MNGTDKLRQLTYVYRTALAEGIVNDNWVTRLQEKMNDYGRNLVITASEFEDNSDFLEWVTNDITGSTDIEGIGFFTNTDLALALHDYQKCDPKNGDLRTCLEVLARERAVEKASPVGLNAVELAYSQLYDAVICVENAGRYVVFRALNQLIREVETWLDGCKMIDISIW